MIDFEREIDFDQNVYMVDDETNQIYAFPLDELCLQCCEETTTPRGNGPKIHARGNELWSWGHSGNNEELVHKFDSKEQADHAVMLCHLYDLETKDTAPLWAWTEAELRELLIED